MPTYARDAPNVMVTLRNHKIPVTSLPHRACSFDIVTPKSVSGVNIGGNLRWDKLETVIFETSPSRWVHREGVLVSAFHDWCAQRPH